MPFSTTFKFLDREGAPQEGSVSLDDYQAAASENLSLSQLMARKFPTDAAKYGSILSQALASNDLIINPESGTGLRSSYLSDVWSPRVQAGAIVTPDGPGTTPAGRIFFPEVILQTIAAALLENKGDFFKGYEDMIGGTETVNAPEFKRARIDVTAPEASESMGTAQLAEPPIMVSITAADTTTAIPTKAIGLLISDQALATTTFDLVNTVMARQAYGERVRRVTSQLSDVLNGNTDIDVSLTALPVFLASTLDAASTTAANFSQKAWIHFLRDNYEKMSVTNIMCTVDTALDIENRANKPTNQSDDPGSPRIDSLFNIDNLGLSPPRVFLVDAAVVPQNRVVGLDREWALRRYINVSANYEAVENFVLRRTKGFRVDSGETLTRLFDDAFTVMDLE